MCENSGCGRTKTRWFFGAISGGGAACIVRQSSRCCVKVITRHFVGGECIPAAELRTGAVAWAIRQRSPTKSNAQLEWHVAKEFVVANDIVVTLYGARDVTELSGVLARIPQSAPDVLVNLNDPLLFQRASWSWIVRVRCGFRQCTVKAYMPTMVG